MCVFVCVHLCRSGNEEKLMALLTPLNVNCHASDGRKVRAVRSLAPACLPLRDVIKAIKLV